MTKEIKLSLGIWKTMQRITAMSLSVAVFFGVLFCTIDDLSAVVSPEHTSHQHTQIHAENAAKYISSREVQRFGPEQCCEDLIAVRSSSSLAISSKIQTLSCRISINSELLQIAWAAHDIQFSSQLNPLADITAKIIQNKRNKFQLKIRPPFGPPA